MRVTGFPTFGLTMNIHHELLFHCHTCCHIYSLYVVKHLYLFSYEQKCLILVSFFSWRWEARLFGGRSL